MKVSRVHREAIWSTSNRGTSELTLPTTCLNVNKPAIVILYKCHLFGVSPPALTSTLANSVSPSASNNPGGQNGFTSHQHQQLPLQQYHSAPHHSSAAWRAHELFQLTGYVGGVPGQSGNSALLAGSGRHTSGPTSDCSLCANIERKYQCVWCQNQCQHQDSCLDGHQIAMGSSSCPPPRIDSVSFGSNFR